MPSKDPIQRLDNILLNIGRIEEHTAGMDLTAFVEDSKTCDAVERCLERISEAAKKLGDTAEDLCPAIPWAKIRGLGNVLRHEYEKVEAFRIWYVVEDDLPPLKEASEAARHTLLQLDNDQQ